MNSQSLILSIKLIILALNIGGTISDDHITTITGMLADAIFEFSSSMQHTDALSSRFVSILNDTVNDMIHNAQYASTKAIIKEKEATVVHRLTEAYHSDMTLDDWRCQIQDAFGEKSAFDYREYTDADYIKVSELFYEHLIEACKNEPELANSITINSLKDIYHKLNNLITTIPKPTATNKKITIISKETRRHKNSFFKESRETELHEIQSLLKENDKICLISGIGGIGKTEMCKYLFHFYYAEQTSLDISYIGWVTYDGSIIQTLYDQILCPKDDEDRLKGYRETYEYLQRLGREALLFVDNIDHGAAFDSEITHLLNLNCRIIITSRIHVLDTAPSMIIGPLSIEYSTKLFYTFFSHNLCSRSAHSFFKSRKKHNAS